MIRRPRMAGCRRSRYPNGIPYTGEDNKKARWPDGHRATFLLSVCPALMTASESFHCGAQAVPEIWSAFANRAYWTIPMAVPVGRGDIPLE